MQGTLEGVMGVGSEAWVAAGGGTWGRPGLETLHAPSPLPWGCSPW